MRRIWSCAGNELLDVVLAYIYLLAYTLLTYLPLLDGQYYYCPFVLSVVVVVSYSVQLQIWPDDRDTLTAIYVPRLNGHALAQFKAVCRAFRGQQQQHILNSDHLSC